MRILSLVLLAALSLFPTPALSAEAKITATWLGVAGFKITDGETTLLFDPVFTKPTLSHWLLNHEFVANPERVEEKLKEHQITRADAIFASHGHFDHAVDIALIAEKTGGVVYGGSSLETIVKYRASPAHPVRFAPVSDRAVISVGKFKIQFIQRDHAAILGLFHFLHGSVSSTFAGRFYDYREGEVWSYRVEHPRGNLLIDQASHFHADHARFAGKTDAYLVGVSNRKSRADFIQNNINLIRPKLVIPSHFDFFLYDSPRLENLRLPFMDLEKIGSILSQSSPTPIRFHIPSRGEPWTIPIDLE